MTKGKNFFLYLLATALVEIRACEQDEQCPFDSASHIADIFHHVPEALTLEWTEEREQRIYEQIHAKARVYGKLDVIKGWEKSAQRRTIEPV